jgi:hypothetical protein
MKSKLVNENLEEVLNEKYGLKTIQPILQTLEKQIDNSKLKFGTNTFIFYVPLSDNEKTKFELNLHIKRGLSTTRIPYEGAFNIFDYIHGNHEINIYIEIFNINNIDKNELMSLIYHELTHIFQFLFFKDSDLSKYSVSKNKGINIALQLPKMEEFTIRVYYSLQHELDATLNMIQNYLRIQKSKTLTHLNSILKTYEPYQHLESLETFNYKKFIDSFKDKNEILYYTNIINKEFNYREITINELNDYYKKWDKRFKRVAKKYLDNVIKIKNHLIKINESFTIKCCSDITSWYDYSYRDSINKNLKKYFSELFENVQDNNLI